LDIFLFNSLSKFNFELYPTITFPSLLISNI
jgi:hypothetical protein